ncbi:MAG TPA: nucleotidyl transferase AbiEii/AbiGii toxin family protein [Cyclobacteriaceae bacterium]|nr:nucleotidyl transferase AbiEii/AbiGii toxin family protein [Cyclobacteriaceae bacterium]
MKDWITKSERERLDILRLVAGKTALPDYMIEKDWWVVIALESIFTSSLKDHFAFKGGTSLSKAWQLLNRFSEDIDIVIDKTLFGIKQDEEIGRGKRGRLRKDAHRYTMEKVIPEIYDQLGKMGIPKSEFNIEMEENASSDQDPTVLYLNYRPLTEIGNGYTKHQIKIEIGVRALMEPSEERAVSSYIAQELKPTEVVSINTVSPERTFWEKAMLLHEEFQQSIDKMNIQRMSRHWYDLDRLRDSGYGTSAMRDQELFNAIRKHRKVFTKVAGIDYDNLSPKNINIFPPDAKEKDWSSDYDQMRESYIYLNPPTIEDLKSSLVALTEEFKNLDY